MSKTKLTISATAVLTIAFAAATAFADPDFGTFSHKAYITFSGYEGAETLTNFPALIRLAEGTGGFSYADCASQQGRDVRFSLGDGRELPSEVVSWNPSGTSEFYVRIPELTASTRIMVFWGNDAAPVRDPRLKVWDRSYTGVYGMEEQGRTILDKSWTGAHGAAANDAGSASGVVGNARTFSAENAVYGNGTICPVHDGKSFSMECWFKYPENPSAFENLLIFSRPPTEKFYYTGIAIRLTPDGKLGAYAGDFSTILARCILTAATATTRDEWHHALATFSWEDSKGEMHLYQNGVEVGSASNFDFVWSEGFLHLLTTGFSDDYNNANKSTVYTGTLDEVRVSNALRSGDYAAAVYKNVAEFENFASMADASAEAYSESAHSARLRHTVTLSAGVGGTISPAGTTTIEEGGTITITATPDSADYGFHSWDGDCPALEKFSSTFTLEVNADLTLSAVFGKAFYVKTPADGGDDANDGLSAASAKASIQTAVAAINEDAANFPAVLFVAPGTYFFDNGKPSSWGVTDELQRHWACYVTNAIAIRATEARRTVIDFRHRDNCGGFLLDNNGALLEGLVLSNAYSSGYGLALDARLRNGHMKNCAVGWSSMAPYVRTFDVDLFKGWIRDTAFTSWTRNNNGASAMGGSVFMKGGIVDSCVFSGCANANASLMVYSGASVDAFKGAGGTVRNCLFLDNSNFASGGAVSVARGYSNNGVANFENCTFVGNGAASYGGGAYADSNGGCNLINCAFSGNSAGSEANGPDFFNANLAHSVSTYATAIDASIVGTPTFRDGSCRPKGTSLTTDAGFPVPWALAPAATDIYGDARFHGAVLDIGAAEYAPLPDDGLEINFAASAVFGVDTLATSFSASVLGAGSGGLAYAWDFGDDTTSTEATPTHTYDAPGYYTVTLTVTDLATGRPATATQGDMIKVIPTTAYVRSSDDGPWTPVEPYASYETAAPTILDAFRVGTAKIACGDGTIAFGTDRIMAERAVEIYGRGPESTLINCAGNYLHLAHAGAILRDVTLFNTYVHTSTYSYQGAVNICNEATVSNCVIRNPVSDSYTRMLWMNSGGRFIDSAVINSSSRYGNVALGAYVDGPATIDRCVFSNLVVKSTGAPASAIQVAGSYSPPVIIRNTLITNCRVTDSGSARGSAVHVAGNALIDNCTIVDNFAKSTAATIIPAGVYAAGKGLAMTNTVVWGSVTTNSAAGGEQTVHDVFVADGKAASFSHCDFTEAGTIASTSVTMAACMARDPIFQDAAHGDYTFGSSSPLLNAGVRLPWMEDAMDLAGNPRLFGRRPDIGCYESSARAQTIILLR